MSKDEPVAFLPVDELYKLSLYRLKKEKERMHKVLEEERKKKAVLISQIVQLQNMIRTP